MTRSLSILMVAGRDCASRNPGEPWNRTSASRHGANRFIAAVDLPIDRNAMTGPGTLKPLTQRQNRYCTHWQAIGEGAKLRQSSIHLMQLNRLIDKQRSEERRVGKECR